MVVLLIAQLLALLWTFSTACFRAIASVPLVILKQLSFSVAQDDPHSCMYYEGHVHHKRKAPVEHSFRYPVRMAVINLDNPPPWWNTDREDHITAARARRFANTDGKVLLLTNPSAAGYLQNPISVYYCHNRTTGDLERCIAEVTNTPWGGRVTFLFEPEGTSVPKCLHVSPMMDMKGTWHLRAPRPKDTLVLVVKVSHPEHGDYFLASLEAKRSTVNASNESAGISRLLRYGFQPHRVALWIYYEAVRLLYKGVPFFSPPSSVYKVDAETKAMNPTLPSGAHFLWRAPMVWPWSATGEGSTGGGGTGGGGG